MAKTIEDADGHRLHPCRKGCGALVYWRSDPDPTTVGQHRWVAVDADAVTVHACNNKDGE